MHKKRWKEQPEYLLQRQICQYIELKYKDVLFMSDTIASVKLTEAQAVRNKAIQKKGFKMPDLIIFEAKKGYHGLHLELKAETPYKLNGELKSSLHLEGQQKSMNQLKEKGYYATFSWGFEKTKEIIDWYLN